MRRFGRNGNHVAFGEVVGHPAFDGRRAHLTGSSSFGADHGPARDEDSLTLDHDENVVGMVVIFDIACATVIGQDDQALDSFQKAIDFSHGKYALAEYSYALQLSKHGKAKDAERIVRYALELGQNQPLGDIALGTVLLYLHRADEAERVARDALSLDSNAREAYLVLAGVHRERADYAIEVQYLDAFLNLEPQGQRAQKVREIRNAIEGLALHTSADRFTQIATISSNP